MVENKWIASRFFLMNINDYPREGIGFRKGEKEKKIKEASCL